jgi:hypothetical protein
MLTVERFCNLIESIESPLLAKLMRKLTDCSFQVIDVLESLANVEFRQCSHLTSAQERSRDKTHDSGPYLATL